MLDEKILLVGSSGFIGGAIADELTKQKAAWVGLVRRKSSGNNIYCLPSLSEKDIIDLIDEYPYVIYAAGSAKPNDFESNTKKIFEEFWEENRKFCELISKSKIKTLLNISSAGTVYGEYVDHPHKEGDSLLPISWYGRAKVIQEMMFTSTCSELGIKSITARVTNPYGNPKATNHGVIDVLIDRCKKNKPFNYYKDVNPLRDFIYAPYMAEIIVKLICKDESSGIYNVGSGEVLSIYDIIEYVRAKYSCSNLSACLHSNNYDVVVSSVNLERIKKELNLSNVQVSVFDYIGKKLGCEVLYEQ